MPFLWRPIDFPCDTFKYPKPVFRVIGSKIKEKIVRGMVRNRNSRACGAYLATGLMMASFAVAPAMAQTTYTWTGGSGSSDNFSSTSNWGGQNGNQHGIQAFAGTTRLTPFADGTGTLNTHRLYFLDGAGAFVISGRDIGLNDHGGSDPTIRNLSTNVQTIMNNIIGDSSSDDPLRINANAGDLVLMGNITNRGSAMIISTTGSSARYVALGGQVSGSPNIEIDSAQLRILEGGSIDQVGGGVFVGRGDVTNTPAAFYIADMDGGTTVGKAITLNGGNGAAFSRVVGALNTNGINTFSGNIIRGASGNRDTTLAQTGGGTVDFNGVISGDHKVIIEGPGIVRFGGNNTYSANTEINSGELHVKEGGTISVAGNTVYVGHGLTPTVYAGLFIADEDGGTAMNRNISVNPGDNSNRTIGGLNTSGTNTFGGAIAMSGSGDRSATLFAAAGGTVAFAGSISGDGAITTTGGGVVNLRGTNTYTGGTVIEQGTLLVNNESGSGTGTGGVTVKNGGTLGGSGGLITDIFIAEFGAAVAPGNSIGELSIDLGATGEAVFETGSYFVFELSLAGASDTLHFLGTGAITFNDNVIHFINLAAQDLELGSYELFTFGEGSDVEGDLVIGSGLEGYEGSSLSMNNGSLFLEVVPEPSSVWLLLAGGAGLISWRNRRHALSRSTRGG